MIELLSSFLIKDIIKIINEYNEKIYILEYVVKYLNSYEHNIIFTYITYEDKKYILDIQLYFKINVHINDYNYLVSTNPSYLCDYISFRNNGSEFQCNYLSAGCKTILKSDIKLVKKHECNDILQITNITFIENISSDLIIILNEFTNILTNKIK